LSVVLLGLTALAGRGNTIYGNGDHINHDYYGIYIDGLARATFGGNHYRRLHTQVKLT
jgi:hypothetical protein